MCVVLIFASAVGIVFMETQLSRISPKWGLPKGETATCFASTSMPVSQVYISELALSHQGTRAVVVTKGGRHGEGELIMLAGVGSSKWVQERVIAKKANCAAWSPDGRYIAYEHDIREIGFASDKKKLIPEGQTDMQVYALSSHNKQTVASLRRTLYRWPTWCFDGRVLAFSHTHVGCKSGSRIAIVRVRKGTYSKPTDVGRSHDGMMWMQWNPRQKKIAYLGWTNHYTEKGMSFTKNLYLFNPATGQTRQLTSSDDVSVHGFAWSPNGQHICYLTSLRRDIKATPSHRSKVEYEWVLYDLDLRNSAQTLLMRNTDLREPSQGLFGPNWSPNGRYLAFEVVHQDNRLGDIGILGVPNRRFHQLTNDGKSKLPLWSKNGNAILYVKNESEIREVSLDGSISKKLFSID